MQERQLVQVPVQILLQLPGGLIPHGRIRLQAPRDYRFDRRGHCPIQSNQAPGRRTPFSYHRLEHFFDRSHRGAKRPPTT